MGDQGPGSSKKIPIKLLHDEHRAPTIHLYSMHQLDLDILRQVVGYRQTMRAACLLNDTLLLFASEDG